jgi:uncharacterized membrane protein YphA (DoxX/SURF4 family)
MERHVNIALWVIAGLLAAAFLAAGITKLVKSKQALEADPRQAWAHDFSAGAIKAMGALGLILPAVTGIAVVLVPLAALGLAVTMVGAIVVHLRRGERQAVVAPVLLLVMSAVVAWGRFGPYAF